MPVLAYLRKNSTRRIVPLFLSDILVVVGEVTVGVVVEQCEVMQVQFPVLPRVKNVKEDFHAVVDLWLHILYVLVVSFKCLFSDGSTNQIPVGCEVRLHFKQISHAVLV